MINTKYRGKRIDNGEWVYGYYAAFEDHGSIISHCIKNGDIWDEVIPESVGQFIGLRDKHGQNTYCSDLVKLATGEIKEIKWFRGSFGIFYEQEGFRSISLYAYNSGSIYWEKVGNIHDNPELLKKET